MDTNEEGFAAWMSGGGEPMVVNSVPYVEEAEPPPQSAPVGSSALVMRMVRKAR